MAIIPVANACKPKAKAIRLRLTIANPRFSALDPFEYRRIGVFGGELPRGRLVVLQELAPHVRPREPPGENRVDDARCAFDDVERRRETELGFAGGMHCRILVGDPPGI